MTSRDFSTYAAAHENRLLDSHLSYTEEQEIGFRPEVTEANGYRRDRTGRFVKTKTLKGMK